jgi:hypothetical protein
MTHNEDLIAFPCSASAGRRARSLEELLSLDNLEFVRGAYLTLLGRQSDEEGESVYLHLIRSGRPKLYILGKLRRSPEGQQFDPGIVGLDRAIRWQRRAMLPIVGKLIAWLTHAETDCRADRLLRSIENRVSLMQDAIFLNNRRLTTLEGRTGGAGSHNETLFALHVPRARDRRMSPLTNEFYDILSPEDIRTSE